MKSKEEIVERLEELDGTYIPNERGGHGPKGEINSLLWVLNRSGETTMFSDCVYVDMFTGENDEFKYGCNQCEETFENLREFKEHQKNSDWEYGDDRSENPI